MNDAGNPHAPTDIFVLAAEGIPGGPLQAVWVVPQSEFVPSLFDQRAYLVGGYPSADPSDRPMGASPGRIVGYDGAGHFNTLCSTAAPLVTVYAEHGLVYAAGRGSDVTVYDPSTHACRSFPLDTFAAGESVQILGIRGSNGRSPGPGVQPIYFVGGATSASGDRPLLYRYDGMTATAVPIPAGTPGTVLHGIAFDPHVGYWIVGEHGTMLYRSTATEDWSFQHPPILGAEERLVSVSIDETEIASPRHFTMVVGGDSAAVVLAKPIIPVDTPWAPPRNGRTTTPAQPLSSVYTRVEWEVYLVGRNGYATVFNGADYYTPPVSMTNLPLLGVHGADGLVIAVGGESGPSPAGGDRNAVIMIRGDFPPRTEYSVDGATHPARGNPRLELGGGAPQ
jgi:hypothetical protein